MHAMGTGYVKVAKTLLAFPRIDHTLQNKVLADVYYHVALSFINIYHSAITTVSLALLVWHGCPRTSKIRPD